MSFLKFKGSEKFKYYRLFSLSFLKLEGIKNLSKKKTFGVEGFFEEVFLKFIIPTNSILTFFR